EPWEFQSDDEPSIVMFAGVTSRTFGAAASAGSALQTAADTRTMSGRAANRGPGLRRKCFPQCARTVLAQSASTRKGAGTMGPRGTSGRLTGHRARGEA